jgi:hypothetical protein
LPNVWPSAFSARINSLKRSLANVVLKNGFTVNAFGERGGSLSKGDERVGRSEDRSCSMPHGGSRKARTTQSESMNDGADLSNPGLSAADQLHLKEVLEAPFAALAAIAGLFVSTEWRARRARRTINLDHPGANAS